MSTVFGPEHCQAYYDAEANYGVKDAAANPLWIGIIEEVLYNPNRNKLKTGGIGSVDTKYIRDGRFDPDFTIRYKPQNATFMDFARSLSSSLTVELLGTISTTYLSIQLLGTYLNRVDVEIPEEDWDIVTAHLMGQNATHATSVGFSGTYASDPATVPLSWFDLKLSMDVDEGYSELTKAGRCSFHIINNLRRVPVIRSSSSLLLKYVMRRLRQLTGEVTVYLEDKTEIDQVITPTDFKIKFELDGSGTPYYEFTGCYWDSARLISRLREPPCRVTLPFTATAVNYG